MNNPWLLAAVGLFHSIMWGAIITLSVAKLGKYTSFAGGWRGSWWMVIAGEVFMLYYALIGSRIRRSAEETEQV